MKEFDKINNLLQYTTTSSKSYNGKLYEGGYHSLIIHGVETKGQRKPGKRLEDIPFDFTNKTVLDIGSNQGGMLFEIQNKIKEGVGIDFDHRLVNASNRIRGSHKYTNLNFFVFNLEKEDFNLINSFAENKFDIIFLLAVCMWIDTWEELIEWTRKNCEICVFESNGKPKQQDKQLAKLQQVYNSVELINGNSADDDHYLKNDIAGVKRKNHPLRKLYICR